MVVSSGAPGPPPTTRLQPPLEESEVSRLKWSQLGLPWKRLWASAGFRAGPVRHGKFSGHHIEGSCSGVYRTFFVGAHPWKVSGRRGGGPGELRLAPLVLLGFRGFWIYGDDSRFWV